MSDRVKLSLTATDLLFILCTVMLLCPNMIFLFSYLGNNCPYDIVEKQYKLYFFRLLMLLLKNRITVWYNSALEVELSSSVQFTS